MNERKGRVAQKSLSRKPEHGARILADAPKHRQVFKFIESLAQNENALVFQDVQMGHGEKGRLRG